MDKPHSEYALWKACWGYGNRSISYIFDSKSRKQMLLSNRFPQISLSRSKTKSYQADEFATLRVEREGEGSVESVRSVVERNKMWIRFTLTFAPPSWYSHLQHRNPLFANYLSIYFILLIHTLEAKIQHSFKINKVSSRIQQTNKYNFREPLILSISNYLLICLSFPGCFD